MQIPFNNEPVEMKRPAPEAEEELNELLEPLKTAILDMANYDGPIFSELPIQLFLDALKPEEHIKCHTNMYQTIEEIDLHLKKNDWGPYKQALQRYASTAQQQLEDSQRQDERLCMDATLDNLLTQLDTASVYNTSKCRLPKVELSVKLIITLFNSIFENPDRRVPPLTYEELATVSHTFFTNFHMEISDLFNSYQSRLNKHRIIQPQSICEYWIGIHSFQMSIDVTDHKEKEEHRREIDQMLMKKLEILWKKAAKSRSVAIRELSQDILQEVENIWTKMWQPWTMLNLGMEEEEEENKE